LQGRNRGSGRGSLEGGGKGENKGLMEERRGPTIRN